MKTIGIIDYGVGNLGSVANALRALGVSYEISGDPKSLQTADALILPGVGAAGKGMENLKARRIDQVLIEMAEKGTPILGICLGMQLLMDWSEEGDAKCLGLIKGNVRKFNGDLKVPQIGWNQVRHTGKRSTSASGISCRSRTERDSGLARITLFEGILDNNNFYFVHSYVCEPEDKSIIIGVTNYGREFCSIFQKDNLFGVQFHPEKSGEAGFRLLRNFTSLRGT